MAEQRLNTGATMSIGIGAMVGGGIFAVTGIAVEWTRGAIPLAFIVAGAVALLTAYSYWRITLRYPSQGGTVSYLNRAFGRGFPTGAFNIQLCLNYIVLLAIYSYAFGAYGAKLFPPDQYDFWKHTLTSSILVGLVLLNYLGPRMALRSEHVMNIAKLILLALFVIVGLLRPIEWSRLAPDTWVGPGELVAGAMIVFLNYEGFELIANAGPNVANPKKVLPRAYFGSIAIVMPFYVLVGFVVAGHLSVSQVEAHSDYSLSAAARSFLGDYGAVGIVIAAMIATSSAMNAIFYGSGKLVYRIARAGQLPTELEREIRGQHLEGMLIFGVGALALANFVPLDAIAMTGSAGFLLVYCAVNVANVILGKKTHSRRWISVVAALACFGAFVALIIRTVTNPETRWHFAILLGFVAGSLVIEGIYRGITGRKIRVIEEDDEEDRGSFSVM